MAKKGPERGQEACIDVAVIGHIPKAGCGQGDLEMVRESLPQLCLPFPIGGRFCLPFPLPRSSFSCMPCLL